MGQLDGINRLFARVMRDFEQTNRQREAAQAKADPHKYKLTRVFDVGHNNNVMLWRGQRNGKGQMVRFGYTVHANAAGFYLSFRQVEQKNGTIKRDMFAARRKRKDACALAERRMLAMKGKT